MKWDPGRYLPDRAEDKKKPFGYVGWGAGKFPCVGTRVRELFLSLFLFEIFSRSFPPLPLFPYILINMSTKVGQIGTVHDSSCIHQPI
jgi:hypothetical protein